MGFFNDVQILGEPQGNKVDLVDLIVWILEVFFPF